MHQFTKITARSAACYTLMRRRFDWSLARGRQTGRSLLFSRLTLCDDIVGQASTQLR